MIMLIFVFGFGIVVRSMREIRIESEKIQKLLRKIPYEIAD